MKKKIFSFTLTLLILALPHFVFAANTAENIINAAQNATGEFTSEYAEIAHQETVDLIQSPQLRITIPGLNFANSDDINKLIKSQNGEAGEKYIVLPFLGDYMVVMYRYAIIAMGILAVVSIMYSGVQWMLPGNIITKNESSSNQAKERIARTLIGLGLAVGSYTILYAINPALTQFKNLKLLYIPAQDINLIVMDKGEPGNFSSVSYSSGIGKNRKIANTEFDDMFKAFANCYNLDWRVLKGVAYQESKLNEGTTNKYGFKGLFQTREDFCPSYLSGYPAWSAHCKTGLHNPWINTAAGVNSIYQALEKVRAECSDKLNTFDTFTAIYIAHNSGNFALEKTLENSNCQGWPAMRDGLEKFWKEYKRRPKNWSPGFGTKRAEYARKTAQIFIDLGVVNPKDTSQNGNAQCPLNFPPDQVIPGLSGNIPQNVSADFTCSPTFDGKSILAIGDSITNSGESFAKQLRSNCPKIKVTIDARDGRPTPEMLDKANSADFSQYDYLFILGGVNNIGNATIVRNNLTAIYRKAREGNTKVVAFTITPWKGFSSYSDKNATNTNDVNRWIRQKAPTPEGNLIDYVIDSFALLEDPANPGAMRTLFWTKGPYGPLHPNGIGHKLIAQTIAVQVFNGKVTTP